MDIADQTATGEAQTDTPSRCISIVDDDASIREALKRLMRAVRWDVELFASAEDFLCSQRSFDTACLILDVSLPGMSGFELQDRLNREGRDIPLIFITAHSDDASRERALKNGAIDFLSKPVRRDPLFKAIETAVSR
jgi:FixJ family two-component response regulator